jgi:hemerythrin-like domain-containing protein
MKAIEDLTHEHRVIELALTGLEGLAADAEKKHRLDGERAEQALEILRNFADRCHHAKEERNLFRLMEERGVPREGGPLGVMLHDHELGRAHVQAMGQALPAASTGDAEAVQAFAEQARGYAALLRQHIRKEDGVLYPMAERILSREDDARLMEAFEAIERDEIGEGVHEKYHQWAHELAGHGH